MMLFIENKNKKKTEKKQKEKSLPFLPLLFRLLLKVEVVLPVSVIISRPDIALYQ